MTPVIKIKRAYEKPVKSDGYRVLVDRLWPRGVKKDVLALDAWAKDLAPSAQLRKWWGHDPGLWTEFQKKYKAELADSPAIADFIKQQGARRVITLVYGAKDTEHNQAVVLKTYLDPLFSREA